MAIKYKVPIEVEGQVSAEYLDLSTATTHSVNAGEIAWNSVDGTFDIGLLNGVTLQAGQEMHFYGKATEAISNGNAVMFAGVQGDHILIAKADAVTINANPEYFMGIATQDFATNDFGYVTAFGNVRGIDTSAYTLGDILYYDSTTGIDGLLTPTMPSAPKAKIIVAAVVRVHATQGILAVRPHTMPRLKDIQDINVGTATAGEILQLQSDGVWENRTLSEAGIVSGSGTTNYVSKFTSGTTLGNSQIFDNGTNVGIGTSSPSEKLEVNGNIIIPNGQWYYSKLSSGTSVRLLGVDSSNNLYCGLDATTNTIFRTNGTERMRITSTGNVGIGTTSALTLLQIGNQNSSSDLVSLGVTYNSSRSTRGGITWRDVTNVTGRIHTEYDGTMVSMVFGSLYNSGYNSNSLMTIRGNGNVGIGTSSPVDKLVVSGAVRSNNQANSFSVGGVSSLMDMVSSSKLIRIGSIAGGDALTGSQGDVAFLTRGVENMRITSAGDVGIGTTAPLEKLDVSGDIIMTDTITGQANLKSLFGTIVSHNLITQNYGFANNAIVSNPVSTETTFYTGTEERMRITSDGNVGIGTSSPSTRFYIKESIEGATVMTVQCTENTLFGAGLIDFKNFSGSTIGSIFYTGFSTNYNTSSDYRLKDNIVEIERPIERLNLLKPVKFNFINKPDTLVEGFIAHEVQEVIPEAVTGKKDELDKYGNPKYQGIDQSKIVPLLTAALQEAVMKINELEKRIQNIENNK